jgi:uncharacterized membrane protein
MLVEWIQKSCYLFEDGCVLCLTFIVFSTLGSSSCAFMIDVGCLCFMLAYRIMMRWSVGAGINVTQGFWDTGYTK